MKVSMLDRNIARRVTDCCGCHNGVGPGVQLFGLLHLGQPVQNPLAMLVDPYWLALRF
jgi:hypothetical protein